MPFRVSNTLLKHLNSDPGRATAFIVLAISFLHLFVTGHFDLSVDEAHYALYGLKADWSYFDHPPMVGWMQSAVLFLSGSEFALRLWPVLLGAASSLVLYRLTRRLFPDAPPWLGLLSVLILQSAVIFQLISMALVPEGPLLFFGLSSALYLFSAVREGKGRDWLMLGLCLGLAGLSKYTAVLIVVSALVFLAVERRWRLLLSPWPWLAVLVPLVLISPVLYWNATNDWLSFRYQLGHGAPDRDWQLLRFVRAQLGQMFAYAPGVYVLGLAALVGGLRRWDHPGVRFSLLLALPMLLLFGYSGGLEETLPHWTLLSWAALAPLTAWWLHQNQGRRWIRGTAWMSAVYSVVFTLLIHAQLFHPWLPFQEHRHPFGDLYGWRDAAERAATLYDAMESGKAGTAIFVPNWSLASRIAWYARPRPVQVIDRRFDQFDLWFGSPRPGDGGVLILPERFHEKTGGNGLDKFAHCEERDRFSMTLGATEVHDFLLYECNGYIE